MKFAVAKALGLHALGLGSRLELLRTGHMNIPLRYLWDGFAAALINFYWVGQANINAFLVSPLPHRDRAPGA